LAGTLSQGAMPFRPLGETALRPSAFALAAAALLPMSGPVMAQSSGIELELNTAADLEGNCRLTYVVTNTAGADLEQTSYEMAIMAADGAVSRLLVLGFGAMPAGKTRVVQFDVPETQCSGVSRIIVNGPVECLAGGQPQPTCDRPNLSSRVPTIQFN
jgi:hypothetical protein